MAAKDFRSLAGLRGAQWDPDRLPSDMRASVHTLTTTDGANVTGYLYRCGGETAVAVLMHPREILATHYLVPELLEAGVAVWVQGSRAAGNDLRLEHELALLDVDAGTSFLAGRGYAKQVLVGNSGGGGLFAYYAEQASLKPDAREVRTPAGRPVKLSEAPMIAPDANLGGTAANDASAPVASTASFTESKIGMPSTSWPPLPGVTPPTTCVP